MLTQVKILEEKIKERTSILENTLAFVEEILEKAGKVTHHQVHRWHTNHDVELTNFHDFSFYGSYGHSQMGGNDIKITHKGIPVLEVYCQTMGFDIKECQIKLFNELSFWVNDLTNIIKYKDKYISEVLKKEENKQKEIVHAQDEDKKKRLLTEEAKRLGVKVD